MLVFQQQIVGQVVVVQLKDLITWIVVRYSLGAFDHTVNPNGRWRHCRNHDAHLRGRYDSEPPSVIHNGAVVFTGYTMVSKQLSDERADGQIQASATNLRARAFQLPSIESDKQAVSSELSFFHVHADADTDADAADTSP
jgi:hypothetical protein